MDRCPLRAASAKAVASPSKAMKFIAGTILLLCPAFAGAQAILEGERFHPVTGSQGMAVTSHTLATEVALEVLKEGGEANKIAPVVHGLSPQPCKYC